MSIEGLEQTAKIANRSRAFSFSLHVSLLRAFVFVCVRVALHLSVLLCAVPLFISLAPSLSLSLVLVLVLVFRLAIFLLFSDAGADTILIHTSQQPSLGRLSASRLIFLMFRVSTHV